MNRILVDSSNIESVGYDRATQTLEVEFKNGYIYQYFDVPETDYTNMLNSSSVGQYLARNIKGVYRYART